MKKLLIIFVVTLSLVSIGNGLECYVCTSSDVSRDEVCEAGNATLLPSISCPTEMKYCIYSKTQWNTISGADSVFRSCTDELLWNWNGQHDLEDGNLTVWYESCGTDLCNYAHTLSKDQALMIVAALFSFLLANKML